MFIVQNYFLSIVFCFVTMICWGSWANTQKLISKQWRFELFYWDYVIGILVFSLFLAFTLGSVGSEGRSFLTDISQATNENIESAFLGGIIFNIANILLVAAISIAGMAVAFPVGIGLALVIGVLVNYLQNPIGNQVLIFVGTMAIAFAIILNAIAYRKIVSTAKTTSTKGLLFSIVAGVLMGFFYKYVAVSMFPDFTQPISGKLSPYSALVIFSLGIFLSNFIFNSLIMRWSFTGQTVRYKDYLYGKLKDHLLGIIGGVIWCIGMSLSILASGKAGPAISYGLGQGATIVSAIWGIFIWKEFKGASAFTMNLLKIMLALYVIGLGLIIYAR